MVSLTLADVAHWAAIGVALGSIAIIVRNLLWPCAFEPILIQDQSDNQHPIDGRKVIGRGRKSFSHRLALWYGVRLVDQWLKSEDSKDWDKGFMLEITGNASKLYPDQGWNGWRISRDSWRIKRRELLGVIFKLKKIKTEKGW